MPQELKDSQHLGDGVYMRHDGYHLWLFTYDGYRVTNEIALDSHVQEALYEKLSARYHTSKEEYE